MSEQARFSKFFDSTLLAYLLHSPISCRPSATLSATPSLWPSGRLLEMHESEVTGVRTPRHPWLGSQCRLRMAEHSPHRCRDEPAHPAPHPQTGHVGYTDMAADKQLTVIVAASIVSQA